MENEVKEVLEEELTNESVNVNRKGPKALILGVVALAGALLFKFRNKISTKIETRMVNKLTKKGYVINAPGSFEAISDNIINGLE